MDSHYHFVLFLSRIKHFAHGFALSFHLTDHAHPLTRQAEHTQSLLRILIQTNGALSTGKTGLVHVKVGGYYCSWASEIVLFVVVFFTQEQDYLACKNKQF